VHVSCTFWGGRKEPPPELEVVRAALRRELAKPFEMRCEYRYPVATIETDDPGAALTAAVGVAKMLGCALWPQVLRLEPAAAALARVRDDLVRLSRRPSKP
jgi:hypothetical protein